MATKNYEGRKYEKDRVLKTVESLTIEEALQININHQPFTVTMRTPGDDVSLVRGLLHSEGILKDINYVPEVILKKENINGIVTEVDLIIPEEELNAGYFNNRSLISVSSCGICGKTELGDISIKGKLVKKKECIDINILHELFQKMGSAQHDFRKSGGTHAAAAFNLQGELLFSMEDIGRHNAVDKVIGALILAKKIQQASWITVSGRVSYEIVIKCFKAKIPFLAAVSAPSSMAVDYAEDMGITLFGFCRDQRATCYSNPERIKMCQQKSIAS